MFSLCEKSLPALPGKPIFQLFPIQNHLIVLQGHKAQGSVQLSRPGVRLGYLQAEAFHLGVLLEQPAEKLPAKALSPSAFL